VYAPSHMGHARTYLGFDILRRIMTYFRYNVTLIMNITDLDDKIIERSAEQGIHHLELSQRYESEFFKDMADLGVQVPSCVTRVTEYMDDIVAYIQRIIDKKLAYESNGSVYFHVTAFESVQPYCKLAPEQIHNAALLAEGEGKLTQDFVGDKKSPRDFALWKKSKPGEPTWDSPWGHGRPGWHIECSVMASDVLYRLTGSPNMDVHSGGVDLKFPHHDNEMAQAEAESGSKQWVNYFVHSGHLHIKGLKMSKSLKNFITIQQALEINSARQIRMLFLLHRYNASMDYGDNTMCRAVQHEKVFVEFFHNAKACLRSHPLSGPQKWDAATVTLQQKLSEAQMQVDDALKDDFDTPNAIACLVDLVKSTNQYMEQTSSSGNVVGTVVHNVASYITRMFHVFGLITTSDGIGFGGGDAGASSSAEQVLTPVLDAVMSFRSNVRESARKQGASDVLRECDDFRDRQLPPLGIRLEDKSDGSVWKLADPAELLLEMQQKQAEAERKAEEKARREAEEAKKADQAKLSPDEYMKQLAVDDGTALLYSTFGDDGMPTHDHAGEPLNKTQIKKAAKLFKAQQSKYEKYVKSTQGST
jgi:cysteinyl-tRNA synthetase